MKTLSKLILVGLILAAMASGATMTQAPCVVPVAGITNTANCTFDYFDPSLGTLTGVTLVISGVSGSVQPQVINNDQFNAHEFYNSTATLYLPAASASPFESVSGSPRTHTAADSRLYCRRSCPRGNCRCSRRSAKDCRALVRMNPSHTRCCPWRHRRRSRTRHKNRRYRPGHI